MGKARLVKEKKRKKKQENARVRLEHKVKSYRPTGNWNLDTKLKIIDLGLEKVCEQRRKPKQNAWKWKTEKREVTECVGMWKRWETLVLECKRIH